MEEFTNQVGIPVTSDTASLTVGENGPVLMQDTYLMEKIGHFNKEFPPLRRVHTKGAGVHGYFEVTNDVTKYTCADFLSKIGKRTDLFARFSPATGGQEASDTIRDIRGFAMKFYTEDGNYDILSISLPAFFFRDVLKFPDFIHSQKGHPITNIPNPNMAWDYLSLNPESIHATTLLFTDIGTPASYNTMETYGPNTFMWYNSNGEYFYVKYHFIPNEGIKNFTNDEAIEMGGKDPDILSRKLYDSIRNKKYPSWKMCVQIMNKDQAEEYRFNPFDVTQVWFHSDFPLIEVGNIILNKLPNDYFTEVEESAFAPNHFVPGIAASNDTLLQGRMFVYQDAQSYRIGTNVNQIPINRPKNKVFNYERNGTMNVSSNGSGGPNYNPNSYIDSKYRTKCKYPPIPVEGKINRYEKNMVDAEFFQAGELYRRVLNNKDRENLVYNITFSLSGANKRIQYRQTALFYKVDKEFGRAVSAKLNLDLEKVERLAGMSQKERIDVTKNWDE